MFGWLKNIFQRGGGSGKALGRWGERRSERFLRAKGLKTLERNFSCKTGEIDLIMLETDGQIVFVEVKTRKAAGFISPESVVTLPKQNRIYRTARYFMAQHSIEDRAFRFDVVSVVADGKRRAQISHYENAFSH